MSTNHFFLKNISLIGNIPGSCTIAYFAFLGSEYSNRCIGFWKQQQQRISQNKKINLLGMLSMSTQISGGFLVGEEGSPAHLGPIFTKGTLSRWEADTSYRQKESRDNHCVLHLTLPLRLTATFPSSTIETRFKNQTKLHRVYSLTAPIYLEGDKIDLWPLSWERVTFSSVKIDHYIDSQRQRRSTDSAADYAKCSVTHYFIKDVTRIQFEITDPDTYYSKALPPAEWIIRRSEMSYILLLWRAKLL